MAMWQVLAVRRQREAELERERLEADRQLVELESWAGRARRDLEEALEQREQAEQQLAKLEARLEAALTDDEALGNLLRSVGEERTAAVVEKLGWYDDDEAGQ
jgi:hypothetical protein